MSLRLALAGRTLALATLPATRRFEAALADPAAAQADCLRHIVRRHAATAYGRAHGLDRVTDLHDLRSRLPVATWECHQAWVQRAMDGEPDVLSPGPVRAFEPTSGSTAPNKLIPVTAAFLREVRAAVYPWLNDLLRSWPTLRGTSVYWSISPLLRSGPSHTPGGTPIGLGDDAAYLGPVAQLALAAQLAVTGEVARDGDLDSCRYRTALALLRAADLGLISVWSPTFLSLLMEYMARHLPDLIRDLQAGTCAADGPAARLRARPERAALLDRYGLEARRLWPRLSLVSCWTAAGAAPYVADLKARFPGVPIQGKGLLATEGVVSIPWQGAPGCPFAVCSHVLELRDVEGPEHGPTIGIEAARPGATYSPILTTGGGLYRYPLGDLITVTGRQRATPCIQFLGRADGGADLAGEKLHPRRAEAALSEASRDGAAPPRFAMLAPESGPPARYLLFLEPGEAAGGPALTAYAARVEACLRRAHHYDYCRRLGQLEALEMIIVRDGSARLERALTASGRRAGDLKPSALAPHLPGPTSWRTWMR